MAEMKLNPREKARLEEEQKNKKTRTKYTIIGIIVALVIVLVVIVNSSLFSNIFPALYVGDTKYGVADVNYEYSTIYHQMAQSYANYGLIDTTKPLDEQNCPFDAEGVTWHDYLLKSAEENMVQKTAFYNEAVKAGYTALTEDQVQGLDNRIATFKSDAAYYGYTMDGYLSMRFGNGNTEKTIRADLTRELIVEKYLNDLYDSYTFTDAELDAYYDENANDLNSVKLLYAFIPAEESEGVDAEAAQAAAEQTASDIVADSMGDESLFRSAVLAATDNEPTETNYAVSTFLSSYEGDVTEADVKSGNVFTHTEGSGCYAVYVVSVEDNNYNCVSVRHILIKAVDEDGDGTYSDEEKQKAYDAVLAIQEEWLAGEATEESFATLANLKSEDSGSNTNGGLYENIYKGQMVEEFDAFCFAGHEHGDYGIVYGETSSYAGYHLIYFVNADGDSYAHVLAENALRSDQYNAAVEAMTEGYESRHGFMWRYVMNT